MDRDTGNHYLYAVGHADGTRTIIKNLGRVPLPAGEFSYFRFAPAFDRLNGA
jgi:hypothetical protein